MDKRFLLSFLTCLILFINLLCLSSEVLAGDHTKLIVHQAITKWIYPFDIKNNLDFIETNREFIDGTTVVSNCSVMSSSPLSESTARNNLAPIANLNSSSLKHMFAFVLNANPGPLDNDAVWTTVAQNWATLAKVIKEYGLVGIVFDNEEYGSSWSNYPNYCPDQCSRLRASGGCQGYSLSECQALVTARGKQIMLAVMEEFPEIMVLTFHGPSVSDPNSTTYGFPNWSAYHEFKGPFFFGFMQGMSLSAKDIDGGESSYNFRTVEQFARAYQYQKYDIVNLAAFMPSDLKSSYTSRVSVSYGIYDGYGMTPNSFQSTILNALNQADHYIWLYLESRSLVTPDGASDDWVNAVRQAKEDYLGTLPPTSPSPSSSICPADVYPDGWVNHQDFKQVLSKWGQTASGLEDLYQDNKINTLDLVVVIKEWGSCPTCSLTGEDCSSSFDCCSGLICDLDNKTCRSAIEDDKYFQIQQFDESFCLYVNNDQAIKAVWDSYQGIGNYGPQGPIIRNSGGFNYGYGCLENDACLPEEKGWRWWNWHFDPAQVQMTEASIEVCDGTPSAVEYRWSEGQIYCPWSVQIAHLGCSQP